MSGRPRLLLLITLAEVGGAQTYVISLLPALTKRFEVTVAASGPGPLPEAARAAGAVYVPLRHVRRALHPLRDLAGLFELVGLCLRVRPDIVHANSSKAGVLGRVAATIARVPVRVFTVHGWAFKAHHGAAARLYLWADRLTRPLTSAVVCVSNSELRAGLAAGTLTLARAVVIPNGVDLARFTVAAGRDEQPVILAVGRLKEPKDFPTLARALTHLESGSFRAQIAGDGPDRPDVERLLPAGASILGVRRDVSELLAAADVFVLASRSEGMPMSILEAMAAGLPVVASAVGGIPEIVVDGQTGILVPPGDEHALAEALRRLVADRGLRTRLGSAGRARAKDVFGLARFQTAHLELYERLLAPYRDRR